MFVNYFNFPVHIIEALFKRGNLEGLMVADRGVSEQHVSVTGK